MFFHCDLGWSKTCGCNQATTRSPLLLVLILSHFLFQIPFGQIQTNLLILTISRNLFFVPSVVIENILIETNRELVHLCVSSWFWWIFAINFLFYVLTLEDFRKLYRQLFFDLNILKSFDVNSSPVNTSNISLNPTSSTLSNASWAVGGGGVLCPLLLDWP